MAVGCCGPKVGWICFISHSRPGQRSRNLPHHQVEQHLVCPALEDLLADDVRRAQGGVPAKGISSLGVKMRTS